MGEILKSVSCNFGSAATYTDPVNITGANKVYIEVNTFSTASAVYVQVSNTSTTSTFGRLYVDMQTATTYVDTYTIPSGFTHNFIECPHVVGMKYMRLEPVAATTGGAAAVVHIAR